MKRFGMLCVLVAIVSGLSAEARAQWFSPPYPPPPPWIPVIAPPPLLVVVPAEEWREVVYAREGGLTYQIGERHFFVDPNGEHWEMGDEITSKSPARFMEPFNCWGQRVPKSVSALPGAEKESTETFLNFDRVSGFEKSVVFRDGMWHFATWVNDRGSFKQVWVARLPLEPEVAPTEVPKAPTIQPIPEEPYLPELVLPAPPTLPLIPQP